MRWEGEQDKQLFISRRALRRQQGSLSSSVCCLAAPTAIKLSSGEVQYAWAYFHTI